MDQSEDSDSDSNEYIGGPDFADFAKQLKYQRNQFNDTAVDFYYPYSQTNTLANTLANMLTTAVDSIPAEAFSLYGNSKFVSERTNTTTLFMIDSKNRDQSAYPLPTNFTLKPPRIYKNVVHIEISQLKLLTSFYYFSATKGNTILPVRELGRESITSLNGNSLTEAVVIPDGTYTIDQLLNQLQLQMNYTPLFYSFPGGFNEFVPRFTNANGDLSVNFNQPGDTYYDSLNNKYITNPTMTQIISYYWPSQYVSVINYSGSQIYTIALSAYYFPVLYELVIDTTAAQYQELNLTLPPSLLTMILGESVPNYIKYNSSGVNDPVISYLITANITVLDTYRSKNTFGYSLVNRYQVSYNPNSLCVNIFTTSLNTSLVNLFTLTTSRNYALALSNIGITSANFSNTSNSFAQATAVFNDMYTFLQKQLISNFAIGYATYSSEFFLGSENILFIQNGIDAINVRKDIDVSYLTSGQIPLSSSATSYSNSPGYWPNLTPAITSNTFANNISSSMTPYSIALKNFVYNDSVIDSNSYISTDRSSRTVNSLITIRPANYTVFKFKSPARQSLQVETLPIPYYYRFADYNKAGLYQGVIDKNGTNIPQQYFDISYAFVYNSLNSNMDNLQYNTVKLSPTYGESYKLLNTNVATFNSLNNISQFEFTAPYPPTVSNGLVVNATSLAFVSIDPISMLSTSWVNSVQTFLYHDRGAFMADLLKPRSENSNHYIASLRGDSTASDITFQFSTFAGNTYYAIVRSTDPACPSNISFTPSVYYPVSSFVEIQTDYTNFDPRANPYANSNAANYPFVVNYNTDFLRLPVGSTLWGADPTNSIYTSSITVVRVPIGYDIMGVSNNLTDYYTYVPDQPGFVPQSTVSVAIDPLSQYTFKYSSEYDTSINSYFGPTSLNKILNTKTSEVYTSKGVSTSQTNIVHWYDGYSIPLQKNDIATYPIMNANISSSATLSIASYLEGFPIDVNSNLQFGYGINAIGFMPTDGAYDIKTFAFKSVIYPKNSISTTINDPNSMIANIGVFRGGVLAAGSTALSNALAVLSNSGSVVYSPLTASNTPGFGVEYGTWYKYTLDTSFSNTRAITGYSQGSNELLNYTSMYYLVPFDSNGAMMTYTRLAGSLVPYPLSQVVSSGSTYFGQMAAVPIGVSSQSNYFMPSTIENANPLFSAQNYYAYTQSQYQQSQPITTTSLGYQDYGLLARNNNALYPFSTIFSTASGIVASSNMGMTTHFSEYNSNLYIVNSLSNMKSYSNSMLSMPGALYASSISTAIQSFGANTDSIYYLLNPPITLQNYAITGLSSYMSSFTFQSQPDILNTSTTIRSYEFDLSTTIATVWLWGGGGGATSTMGTGPSYGGAGAYAKAQINVQMLYSNYGISTIYMVVGKGGNRDNYVNDNTRLTIPQIRYGGGGSALLPSRTDTTHGITIQGGGFSGIFMTSTLSSPILIVGGGGGGGAGDTALGGPGGFGLMPEPKTYYQFSTVTLDTQGAYTIPFSTIQDLDSIPYADGHPISSIIDGDLATYWSPLLGGITYRLNLSFNSNVSTINRLRLYGSNIVGVSVYANDNKIQQLYSNPAISYLTTNQNTYADITPIQEISNATLNTIGWIVGGQSDSSISMLQYSVDGLNWKKVDSVGYSLFNTTVNSVIYVASLVSWFACGKATGILNGGPILRSSDGLNWSNVAVIGNTFTTLAFGGTTLVASDGTQVAYSSDGVVWNYTTVQGITRIRYLPSLNPPTFWGMATGGVYTSTDGSTWTPTSTLIFPDTTYDVAYSPTTGVVAQKKTDPYASLSYNIIGTIGANTWYNAIAIDSFIAKTVVYGLRVFVAGGSTTDGSSCIKYSTDGYRWIDSANTVSQTINELQFFNGQFIAVGQSIFRSSDGINWSSAQVSQTCNSVGYGPLSIVPNLSTLYMELYSEVRRVTPPRLPNRPPPPPVTYFPRIYEIQALNTTSIGFQTNSNVLSNMIDSNIDTSYWPKENETIATSNYSFTFGYSTMTSVNTVEVSVPSSLIGLTTPPAFFTGLSLEGYSNTNIVANDFIQQPDGKYIYTMTFPTITRSNLSINVTKNTTSSIQITHVNGLYDPNLGLTKMGGYCGGSATTMRQSFISHDLYNGGGGAATNGGVGNSGGAPGDYLYGGAPGVAGNQLTAANFSTIVNGAGGGGGGYFGGAGGGSTIISMNRLGGAGGGGAGYYRTDMNLITLLDYGIANPLSNYQAPGLTEQAAVAYPSAIPYGQGGNGSISNFQGQHGLIVVETTAPYTASFTKTTAAIYPTFIDGSKLSVFQASIPSTFDRSLYFTSYANPTTSNWVWYRSYLLLTGNTLLPSFVASPGVPSFPSIEFSYMPSLVYTVLIDVFEAVHLFFQGNTSTSTFIINTIELAFQLFQSFFVNTAYTDPSYIQMTEIYTLLDYLQNLNNLLYPHVNPYNSQLDRILGGLPRFGYWGNPFLKNVSYIGYDVALSQGATPEISSITRSPIGTTVSAMYGLVLEQCLSSGVYELKDIMAYKPTTSDATKSGAGWLVASQFPESYIVRSLSNDYIQRNVPVQPRSFGSAIQGRLPLSKYSVYTAATTTSNVPIRVLNDFEGDSIFAYTFNASNAITLTTIPFTSTILQINQKNITSRGNAIGGIIGTVVSEYSGGTSNLEITQFGLSNNIPILSFSNGPANFYNAYDLGTEIDSTAVGKAINDYNGNLYVVGSNGNTLYQNICTSKIYMYPFSNVSLPYASPKTVLSQYQAGSNNPFYDFFVSKYTNIWHLQGTSNISSLYGARFESIYDFTITTNFVNQVFYPTHKISLVQGGALLNPIIDGTDLTTYPSYQRTQMFFYNNYSTLVQDISGQFAQESAENFKAMDSNSGFFLDSYINNIYLNKSPTTNNLDSYNYLAIRAYSPSETFQTLVRFYLPGRYDYGFISLADLSNEIITIQTSQYVNPEYARSLSIFNSSFSSVRTYGSIGLPGYPGSTITTNGFGDFLQKYSTIYKTVNSNGSIIQSVNNAITNGIQSLITGDLQGILPAYVATRAKPTDSLEFSLPFSTSITVTNTGYSDNVNTNGQYGLGYNLGYTQTDTPFNTVQLAGSFFKILDDYIYLKMNPEYNMNRLDISRLEDFSVSHDTTAESQLYNCKLLLNSFGTYSTTFVQNPVDFNPPIGKLDKLSFAWYDSNGNLIDNSQCDWSAAIQIVERSDIAVNDSSLLHSKNL